MSYSNYHHNRQQTTQPFHHRGVLTKLTSSTSSVGAFSSSVAGGGGGSNGGTGATSKNGLATRAIGAGFGVARNVPKLVNTSSLRKENGGQDITAVLVNRHGGKKSGWGSAITTPATTNAKSKKDSNADDGGSEKSSDDPNNDKTYDNNNDHDGIQNRNSTNHLNNDQHHHHSHHTRPSPPHHTFSGPTPEEAFAVSNNKKSTSLDTTTTNHNNSPMNNNHHHHGEGGYDSKSLHHTNHYHNNHHPHHQPTPWSSSSNSNSNSNSSNMNQDSSFPNDRHRDYHGGNNYHSSHHNHHNNNDRSHNLPPPSNDDFPPFGGSDENNNHHTKGSGGAGGLSSSPTSSLNHYHSNHNHLRQSPPNQYHHGYNDSRNRNGSGNGSPTPSGQTGSGSGPSMRNYGRQPYNDHNYPSSSNGSLYDDQNDYHHQQNSHRLYHNSRRHYNNEYYRGDSNYYNNERFGNGNNNNVGGGSYQDPSNNNSRHHYEPRRASFDNDRYGNHHHNHHQNSYYHNNNMDYDRGYGGSNRRYNNYHSSSSPFDQDRNHGRLYSRHYDQHLPPQRADFGRRDDFGSKGGTDSDDGQHGFGSDHRSTHRQDMNYLHRSNTSRDSTMNYSVNEKIIEEDGQNDEERPVMAPKHILKHEESRSEIEEPSFSDNNANAHPNGNENQNVSKQNIDHQSDDNNDPPQLTDEKRGPAATVLSSSYSNKRIETPSEKERRARLLRQQQENILRQVEATRAELARKKAEEERMKYQEQEEKFIEKDQRDQLKKNIDADHVSNSVNDKIEEAVIINVENIVEEEEQIIENEIVNPKADSSETKNVTEKPVLDEEAIQKLKEEFYARMATERKARAEHRRRRKPRTRGVLFKRLPDGSIVNADLSEEDLAKRAEKRMSRRESRHNGDSYHSRKSKKNPHSSTGFAAKRSQSPKQNLSPVDEKGGNGKNEKKKFVPSPGPAQSAWIAGPPPSMKTTKTPGIESPELIDPENELKNFSNDTTSKTVDQVLSSGLLDIGNNGNTPASWSADTSSQPKVAMGPIMSSWTAFASNGGTVGFHSFGTKPAENTNVSGVDWNMDFALPHDLLSNAVDSEEELPVSTEDNKHKDNKDSNTEESTPSINKRFKKPVRPKKDFKKFKKSGISHHSYSRGQNSRSYAERGFKRNPRSDNRQKKSVNHEAEPLN